MTFRFNHSNDMLVNVCVPPLMNNITVVPTGALSGQLRGQAHSLQSPLDGHLRATDAADGSAAAGGDGEQSQGC